MRFVHAYKAFLIVLIFFTYSTSVWAESTYLEPDEKYGFGYLDAVKRTLMHG